MGQSQCVDALLLAGK